MRNARRIPRDLFALWGGLFLLFFAIAAFVARSNQCAAQEIAAHPSYSFFPGLATDDLPAPARGLLAARLNQRYCTCGCLMTVASCLNNHASCRTSKRVGLEMLEAAHGEIQPAHRRP
jgi:hypothetical protein